MNFPFFARHSCLPRETESDAAVSLVAFNFLDTFERAQTLSTNFKSPLPPASAERYLLCFAWFDFHSSLFNYLFIQNDQTTTENSKTYATVVKVGARDATIDGAPKTKAPKHSNAGRIQPVFELHFLWKLLFFCCFHSITARPVFLLRVTSPQLSKSIQKPIN